jgi:hypothetical protein
MQISLKYQSADYIVSSVFHAFKNRESVGLVIFHGPLSRLHLYAVIYWIESLAKKSWSMNTLRIMNPRQIWAYL